MEVKIPRKKRKRKPCFPENTFFLRIFSVGEPRKRLLFTTVGNFLIALAKVIRGEKYLNLSVTTRAFIGQFSGPYSVVRPAKI